MKTKKRRLEGFLFYDYEHVERHLEKMACKGWRLSKICKWYWEYERIEPANLRFAVTYFAEASQWNPQPTHRQEEFWAFCEAAGWKLAAEWDQMQIMYSEEANPVPVETDEHVKLEMIHRAMKKAWIPGSVALICLTVYQLLDQMPTRIEWFFYDANVLLLALSGIAVVGLFQLVSAFFAFSGKRRKMRGVQRLPKAGKCVGYRNNRIGTVGVHPVVWRRRMAGSFECGGSDTTVSRDG